MDRRAGALVALAACIACSAAAPTASNHTALDLYDGPSEGCYYNFQHYLEGDRIMTNEPCLNCTCHNRMLMCYLRVCPFTKPIGQDCTVEKRADQCCPIVTCPDVPVDLLTSTSTSSPAEYGGTGVGKLDRYGCSINGKYFPEGSKVPPSPNKPCEHCYCIRNMTTCVMQECTLHVDGCTPIYNKDVCCPVRYSCDHPEDEIPLLDDMTTTVRPTPGFLLTTTTIASVTQMSQDCVHDDKIFADGALIKTEKACEHCYCMKGDIVCVVQECGTPMENEGKNCTSMAPREGQCCPDTYICEGDELSNEPSGDIVTEPESAELTTLSPPRRAGVEGSGYRNEDEPSYTEVPIIEPEIEGSGMEALPTSETPEKQPPESIEQGPSTAEYVPHDELSTKIPEPEVSEEATTEPDKGQNTIPDEEPALPAITTVIPEVKHTEPVETTPIEKYDSEYSPTSSPSEDLVTGTTEQAPQKEAEISEHEDKIATTEKDQLSSISDNIEPTTSLPYDKETNSPIELTSEAPVSDNPQTDEQITAGIEPEIKLTTLAEPSRDIDNRESEPGLQGTVSESTSTPTIENASTKQPETEMSSFESEMGLTASLSETDITESPIKVSEESITTENVPATSRPDMETKYTKPTSDNLSEEDHDIKTTDSDLIPEKNDELTTPAIELAPPLEKKPETDLSTPAESDVDQTTPASSPEIKHEDEQSTPSSELDASPEKEHDIDTTLSPEVMTSHEKDLTTPAYESTPTSEKGQEIDVSTQEPNLEPPTEKDQDYGASTSGPESKPPSEIDQDIGSSTPPVELEPPTEKDEDIGSPTSAPELAPENEVDQDNGLTTPAAESVPSVEKNEEPGLSTPVSETSPQSEKDEDSGLSTHTPELPLTKEEGPDTALTTPAAELVPSHDEDKDIDRTSVTELSPSYDKEPNVDLTTPATIPSSDVQKSPEEEQDIYSTTSVSDILPASEKDLDITTPASEIVPLSEKDQEVGLTTPSSETVTSPENEYGTDITTPSIEEATLHEKDQVDKLTTPESNDEKEDKLDVTTPATEHVTTFEKKPDIELTTIVSELTTHLDDTRITTPADSSIIPKKELGEELTTPASELTTTYEKESDFATVSVKEQNVDITTPETEFEMNQDLSTTTASIITSLDERESKPELTTPTSDLTESSHKDEAEITSAPELSTTIPTLSSEHTTSSDIENEIASTITPVVDKLPETTTVSENIEPGRIPGEGDCLLNGITYQNNSHVPSTSKCHSSCSCVSSIIKCDPVICSPPPEYMDNCQPVYDSAESCCPTYVCNDNREPIPPQTHNQVSGTDSPIAPGFECGGGECKKANISEVSDCGSESCEGTIQVHPVITPDDQSQDCKEGKCAPPLSPCNGGECDQPSTQDQPCDSKHGCQALPSKPCVGTECINEPIAPSSDKEEPHICKDPASCEQSPQQTKPICDGTSCASKDRVGAADEICNGETCKPQESAPLPECVGETCTQKKIHDAESQLPCTGQECLEEKPILPIDSTIPVLSTENPLEPSTEEKAPEQDTTSKPYSTAGLEELPVTESEQHTTESNIDISETSSPDKSTSIEQEILSTEKPEDTTRKESVTNLSDLPTSTPQISEVTQEGEVPISELETISSQGDDKTTTEIPKISESDKEIGMEPQEFGERQSTTLSPQDVQQITEINISELPESQEETSTKRVDLKEHPVSDINKVPEESTTVKVESLSTGEESTDIPKVTESEESEDHKTKTTTVKYDIASPDLTVTESATTVVQEGEDKTQHPDSVEYSTEHSTLAPSKQTTASKETITNVMEPEKPICSELECSQETESSQKGASTKSPISENTDQITETSESPEKSESPADGSNLVEPFTNTPIESETDLKTTEIPDSENVEVTTKVFTNDEITPESHVTVPAEFVSKTTINVGSDAETGIPETYITHDDTKTESYGNIATEPYLETTPEDVSQTEAPISPITDTRRNEDNIVTTEAPKETYDNEIIPESSTKKDIIQSEPQTEPPDTVSQTIEAVTQPQEVKKPELEETDQQTTKVDMDTESQFTTKIPLLDEESKTLAPEIPTQEPILENQDKFTEGPITTTKPESDSFSTIKPLLGSEEPEREKLVPTETYDEKTTELPTVEESSTAIPQSPEQDSATTTGKPSYEPITESEKLGTENPEITTVTEPSVTDIPEVTARVTDEPIAQNTESPVPVVINTQETTTVLTDTHEPHKDTSEPYEDEITTRLPVLSDEVTTSIPESIQEQDITKPTDELGLHKNPTEPSDIENDVVKTEQPYVTEKSGVTVQNEDRSTELPAHHDETPVTTILSIDQSQEGSTESPLPLVTELATESDIKTEPDITETPLVSEVPEVHDLEDKSTEKPIQETDYYTTEIPEEGVDKLHNIDSELPVAPDVSKLTESPQAVTEPTKETTEKSELTTEPKNEYSETTPYLVELEEHTHKPAEASTVSPIEEQVTTESEQTQTESDIDLKEPTDYQTTEPETSSDTDVQTTPSSIITPDTSSESSISSTPSESVDSDSSDNRVGDDEQIFVTTEGAIKTTEYQTVEPIVPVIPEKTLPGSESEPEKPIEVEIPVETPEEFIPVTTKVTTTTKPEDELTTESPAHSDKFTKPEEKPEEEEQSPATSAPEVPKPVVTEPQPTEEVPAPEDDGQFPPSGGYGQEPDYVEEDQAFGPGTCRYGGKVYVSAQQIPRDDPCDFCFCFRSDIICLQQSCPPPIHGCHEEPIQGFCCPRYECPVSMATTLNVTTTTTTTTTTLPPHFLPHAYKGQAQRRGCQIKGHTYKVGEVVRASSGPCLHCTCGGDGQMKCDPKACTPEPMLRQMIAAAVSAKRRR